MNPEQEIELVLRVLSTRPTDEEIFHLKHEDVNPRKVEQKPEEEPEEQPEEKPEEEPGRKAGRRTRRRAGRRTRATSRSRRRHPVILDGTVSVIQKFRTHETTSSARR